MRFSYEIYEQEDSIYIYPHDADEFAIPITDFWVFVTDNELNQFCYDEYDAQESDGHKQTTGAHDYDSYFALPYNVIQQDLTKFILKTEYKNYFNV